MAATVSAVSFDLRLGPLRSASSPATPASTSAAAVPTGRAPSSVSGRGGCAVITAIIHRPTVRLTSQYLLLSTRPGAAHTTHREIRRSQHRITDRAQAPCQESWTMATRLIVGQVFGFDRLRHFLDQPNVLR